MSSSNKHLAAFQHLVVNRYHEYDKLFLDLPFAKIPDAGRLLPLFSEICHKEIAQQTAPDQIVELFFEKHMKKDSAAKRFSMLFLFLQFIERQIVLFDALEDSAYSATHDLNGPGTLAKLSNKNFPKDFNAHLVLTAHPTQFYSPQILAILQDITTAISHENIYELKELLLQMGKTAFLRREKPTPYDEAEFLNVYLSEVFYPVYQDILHHLNNDTPILTLGFWPGGDRDGNPSVTAETTVKVAKMLKNSILKRYLNDIKTIKRRLTFKNLYTRIKHIEEQLNPLNEHHFKSSVELITNLKSIKSTLIKEHDGLFCTYIDKLLASVNCFGFHFATLDIRQDSSEHENLINNMINKKYFSLSNEEKANYITSELSKNVLTLETETLAKNKIFLDIFSIISEIPNIQRSNGEQGLHRYIISNTRGAHNVLEIMLLAKYCGIPSDKFKVDIVPLFETINDLKNAPEIIDNLFKTKVYKKHLKNRNNTQTVMVGFSDSTKDGGYLTANWSIYKAKQSILKIAKKYHINVLFFDGKGGPSARGGGNSHLFYKAMKPVGADKHIELTIQGQTISSNFGSIITAKYNVEQLITAALENHSSNKALSKSEEILLDLISEYSHQAYNDLRNHHQFLDYLEHITPLAYFGDLNIASRPPRREKNASLTLNDLRAISFVGSWSQMKQNVPAYFGLGTALKKAIESGYEDELKSLYQNSLFFKTLLNNTMQSLLKTYFPLTEYLSNDTHYGEFWKMLYNEAELTKKLLLSISNQTTLLEDDPIIQESIELREKVVLPLQIIQQYALIALRNKCSKKEEEIFKKLIKKSIATNINASRNSA